MDIFNRPPAISEDSLFYTLYPTSGFTNKSSAISLATVIRTHIDSLLPGHIWHRDPFELKVVENHDVHDAWMLEGKMRVGDCVDDEWCVVWLLKEISAKWNVAISVYDTDGEFLLIEAADALPSWVTPTNAENRVWIYASQLHLIPLSHISAPSSKHRRRRYPGSANSDNEGEADDSEEYLNTKDALNLLLDKNVNTEAPASVEQAVWQRISGYPAAAQKYVHTTLAYIPQGVARALSIDPSLVQKPVETFYTRDALQLRAAHKMARFPPEPSVLRPVKMTRTAYAQLVGQKFHPPKIFGRWTEREGTVEWRRRDVGMKLACGFEMLFQESKNRSEGLASSEALQSSSDARKDALRRNPDYVKYIDNLRGVGYFKNEVEGSALWNEQEDKAAAMFVEARQEDDASRPSFATVANSAITRAGHDAVISSQEGEDSDDWLNVDATDFDAMLEKTMGASRSKLASQSTRMAEPMVVDTSNGDDTTVAQEELLANNQATRLQDLAKQVERFVEGKGEVEGATFADEASDSGEELSDFSDERFSDSDNESDVEMNLSQRQSERQVAMDNLVAPLPVGEYGKMPAAYHENSQQTKLEAASDDKNEDEPPTLPHVDRKKKLETNEPPVVMRPPILARDKYEGVDSDDESEPDDDDPASAGFGDLSDDDSEEDRPQVVGEVEIDMEAEEEEFLEFSRQALGISDAHWDDILSDRKARGAFIPNTAKDAADRSSQKQSTNISEATTEKSKAPREPRKPAPGPRPNVNPNLDSFEAVMQAMEEELARQKVPEKKGTKTSTSKPAATTNSAKPTPTTSTEDKGKGKAKAKVSFADDDDDDDDDDDMDIEAAMDAELKAALERGDEDVGSDDELGDAGVDYNLIKNFLESFKSQAGLSGPVSNLAGRLQPGWTLPRDGA